MNNDILTPCVLDFGWAYVLLSLGCRNRIRAWQNSSENKSTDYSSRGPRFKSQHPLGDSRSSESSVATVPEDLMPSSGLPGTHACGEQTYM